jgi:hypothetical protein
MKVFVVNSDNLGEPGTYYFNENMKSYIEKIYDKYGTNVISEHIVSTVSGRTYIYHVISESSNAIE